MHWQAFLLLALMPHLYHAFMIRNASTSAPPSSTIGWSDQNYEVDDPSAENGYNSDSYGKGRYNSNSKGKGRYNNRKDGYGKDDDGYDNDNDGYNNNNNDDDDDDNYDADNYDQRSSRQKREPDEYGNMNIYLRDSSKYGKQKKYKRMRFPVHRFKPGHFPPLPPLISFLPWLPIFHDKLTKQTIIFSPTGGLYIIPPVINFYGQRFSIAELIASGYASLAGSGVLPPPAVNVAPLVRPGAVVGPGIPPPNLATGGFSGGVQTQLGAVTKTNPGPYNPPNSNGSYGK